MVKAYSTWSRAKLEAERDRLALERTRVREAQNAVDAALTAAAALERLSPAEREALVARSEGGPR